MARVFIFNGHRWDQKHKNSHKPGEWAKTFDLHISECIWFSDPNNFWYQEDYWQDKIKYEIEKNGIPDLSIGHSMGGWAALLYQPIINARKVLAFSPQTITDVETLKKWPGKENKNWAADLSKYTGNVKYLPASDNKSTLYYGKYENDTNHIKLAQKLGYKIISTGKKGHNSAKHLKESNQLIPIISKALV